MLTGSFQYYDDFLVLHNFLNPFLIFHMFLSLANFNYSIAHYLLHILFLSIDHSCLCMFLSIYIFLLLTYIEHFVLYLYILHFALLVILLSTRILITLIFLAFLCLPVHIVVCSYIFYFDYNSNHLYRTRRSKPAK